MRDKRRTRLARKKRVVVCKYCLLVTLVELPGNVFIMFV